MKLVNVSFTKLCPSFTRIVYFFIFLRWMWSCWTQFSHHWRYRVHSSQVPLDGQCVHAQGCRHIFLWWNPLEQWVDYDSWTLHWWIWWHWCFPWSPQCQGSLWGELCVVYFNQRTHACARVRMVKNDQKHNKCVIIWNTANI